MYDIIILDDEKTIRTGISQLLEEENYSTRECQNYQEFQLQLDKKPTDLVILDIWLIGSNKDGLQILKKIKKNFPSLPVLIISGHANINIAVEALKNGAGDFIEKPFGSQRLLSACVTLLKDRKTINISQRFRPYNNFPLIGNSDYVTYLKKTSCKLASSNANYAITGEEGTGKYSLTTEIHLDSDRKDFSFYEICCTSKQDDNKDITYPDSIIVKIKRAITNKIFATLFIKNIQSMPIKDQSVLLDILQKGKFKANNKIHKVNCRIVISANDTLENLINNQLLIAEFKDFFPDELNLLPLKEHLDDLPLLIDFYNSQQNYNSGTEKIKFPKETIEQLKNYNWPGNLSELRRLTEHLIILTNMDKSLTFEASYITDTNVLRQDYPYHENNDLQIYQHDLKTARNKFERKYLLHNLNKFGYNITKTAKYIKMERSALHKKLKLLGINIHPKLK